MGATALVRGELLADEPYSDWVGRLRDLYRERHLQALVDAADAALSAWRFSEALDLAEQALALDPTRERGHRASMLAHYAMGEQVAATRAYDRCRSVLAETIGADPLPDTERLYVAILNQDPVESLVPDLRVPPRLPGRPRSIPTTEYAAAGAAYIAYQAVGRGQPDVVFMPGSFSHIEVGWEEPRYAKFLESLASRWRLIVFDKRGTGMSDPGQPSDSFDERVDDIRAVMDAAASDRAVLFGVSEGAPSAVAFAARHPERVLGLVLYSSFARLLAAPDYPWGWTAEFLDAFKDSIDTVWRTGRMAGAANPTVTDDPDFADWMARYFRLAASPSGAKAILDFYSDIDIRDVLPCVACPTLVIHRREENWISAANGRYVAEHIQGARYLEVPGVDHWPWIGNAEDILGPVLAFIDELG